MKRSMQTMADPDGVLHQQQLIQLPVDPSVWGSIAAELAESGTGQ